MKKTILIFSFILFSICNISFAQTRDIEIEEEIENKPFNKKKDTINKGISLIALGGYICKYSNGISLSYAGFPYVENKNWTYAMDVSYNFGKIKDDFFYDNIEKGRNIYSYTSLYYGFFGINAMRKIENGLWLQLKNAVTIGYETYNETKGGFLVGLKLSQGVCFFKKKGVYLSVGLYEYISTSRVYWLDYGVKFEIGFAY